MVADVIKNIHRSIPTSGPVEHVFPKPSSRAASFNKEFQLLNSSTRELVLVSSVYSILQVKLWHMDPSPRQPLGFQRTDCM